MSMNSLANSAAARREDFLPLGRVPQGPAEIASAAMTPPRGDDGRADGITSGLAVKAPNVDTALNVLFGQIPTEILTLYVAVLATLEQVDKVGHGAWTAFVIFLACTPVVFWLIYATKIRNAGKPVPSSPADWPIWEMFAATVAFAAWAFALPNSPFKTFDWYSPGLSGIAVLIVSTTLGLLAPLFQKPLS